MFHFLLQDIRYSLRSILKNPLASLTIVLSLAVGMGITTTAFSILNAMALADLPGVEGQDGLMTFALSFQGDEDRIHRSRLSLPDLRILQGHPEVFSDVAASGPMRMAVDPGAGAELVQGEVVTANYFRTLGAVPLLGRFFTSDEAVTGGTSLSGAAVAVLSHRYWRARFGEDPGVVGRIIRINGRTLEVVGVAEEGFTGMTAEDAVDGSRTPLALWVPLANATVIRPSWTAPDPFSLAARWLRPVARLAGGVSKEAAVAALPAIARELEATHSGDRARAEIVHGDLVFGPGAGPWRPTLTVLGFMVVPLIVLLVACANAANLLLARNAFRRREISIRKALGASRRVLFRQLMVESAILALAAGGMGLLVALGARRLAGIFSLHLSMEVPLDWRVFSFTLGASLVAGLLFGLMPAFRAAGGDVGDGLSAGGRGNSGGKEESRLRDGLVVAQVALGLLLLVSSGLFVRSAQHGLEVDSGMEESRLLLLTLDLDVLGFEAAEGRAFYRQLMAALRTLPGVEEAALADRPPLQGFPSVRVAASPGDAEFGDPMPLARVGDGFMKAAGIPLRAGRSLVLGDVAEAAPVAILNHAAAERLFPGQDPLGRRLSLAGIQESLEVVGVVEDTRSSLYDRPEPMVYLPLPPAYSPGATVYIRTDGPPERAMGAVRTAVLAVDPRLPLQSLEPAREVRRRLLAPWRLGYLAMGFLGAVAVALAGAGLYGVLSCTVTRKTREIGVRMALGADTGAVVRMILSGALRLLAIGLGVGFLLSAAVATLLKSALFGVSPMDPWVYGRVGALLSGITILAALLPTLRAAAVEPVRAMGEE